MEEARLRKATYSNGVLSFLANSGCSQSSSHCPAQYCRRRERKIAQVGPTILSENLLWLLLLVPIPLLLRCGRIYTYLGLYRSLHVLLLLRHADQLEDGLSLLKHTPFLSQKQGFDAYTHRFDAIVRPKRSSTTLFGGNCVSFMSMTFQGGVMGQLRLWAKIWVRERGA